MTTVTRLVSGALVRVYAAEFAGLTGFYLLLAVVAQYAARTGGLTAAGLATAVLMLTTVAAEFAVPAAVRRFGHRTVLAAGLVLLGAPALVLPASDALGPILATCVLRGCGLAVMFVVCGELSAVLVPAERRGEGLGVLGIVSGVPAVIALPLGVWLLSTAGYTTVFVLGGLVALAGLVALPGLALPALAAAEPLSIRAGLRTPALLRPALLFASTTVACGIVATFLPAAVPGGAALPLLVQAATATGTRWWAGRFGDRHGAARLLVPGLLTASTGMLVLSAVGNPAAVLTGAALFGAGFGVVQNASLAVMYERVPASAFGTVTALWSIAYDGGWGIGAAGFGVLAGRAGYPVGFVATAAVMLLALLTVRRHRSG